MAANSDEEIQVILEKFPGIFEKQPEKNKLRCKLTGHDIPCIVKALEGYTSGKKFQALSKKVISPKVLNAVEKYKEYFVPSKKSSSRLYCTLTGKEINKFPHEIERYTTGYKFRKALYTEQNSKNQVVLENGSNGHSKTEMEKDELDKDEIPSFALSSEEEEIVDIPDNEEEEKIEDIPDDEEEQLSEGGNGFHLESPGEKKKKKKKKVLLSAKEELLKDDMQNIKRKQKPAKQPKKKKLKISS